MILWPTAESTAVLRVPSSTHSRHLVTSRRVRAQVSESRRTERAVSRFPGVSSPPECPRVRCLSLCPARILAVPRVPRGSTVFSSVLTWTPQSGECERLSDRPAGTTSISFLSLTCASDSRTNQLARPPPSFLSLKSASDSRTFRQAGGRRGGFHWRLMEELGSGTLPWTLLASWLRYVVLGSRVHLHGLLKLWNRLRSVVGREDMMAMAVVPCRLFSRTRELACLESGSCVGCVLNQFLIWLHVLLSSLSGSACYCGAGLWFLRWCWSWTVSSSSSSLSRWYCRYVSPSTRHAAFDSISRLLVSSSKASLAGSLGFLQLGNCFTWPRSFRPADVGVLLAARSVPSVLAPSLSLSSVLVLPLPLSLARATEFGLSFPYVYVISFCLSYVLQMPRISPFPRDWLDFRSSETPRQLDEP